MSYYDLIDIDEDGNPITKEYSNQIEYEIEHWFSDNNITMYDVEGIEYILSIRKSIIDELHNDDSVVDKSRIDIIKFLEEKYLIPTTQALVQNNVFSSFPIPKSLKDFKPFEYKPKPQEKNEIENLSKWAKEVVKLLLEKGKMKQEDISRILDKHDFPKSYYGRIDKVFSSKCKEFYNHEITREGGYWELKNPKKIRKLLFS
jgi:hypothetical protein